MRPGTPQALSTVLAAATYYAYTQPVAAEKVNAAVGVVRDHANLIPTMKGWVAEYDALIPLDFPNNALSLLADIVESLRRL